MPPARMLAAAAAAVVAVIAADRAASAIPANVKVVSRATQSGAPSPDGTRFLYPASDRRGEAFVIADASTGKPVTRIAVPRTRCTHSYCEGQGIQAYAWAPTGAAFAFSVDTGDAARSGLYVVDLARKKPAPRRVAAYAPWQLVYDASGDLVYLTGDSPAHGARGAKVYRAGDDTPVLELPDRADAALGADALEHRLHRTVVVTTVKVRNQWSQLVPDAVWITELATGKARRLAVPAGVSIDLAPTEDRACYAERTELRCFDLAGGAPALAIADLGCQWGGGDAGYLPWSPNGRKVAAFTCTKGGPRAIAVHDLDTGVTTAFPDESFGWVQFQTDDLLLLLYGQMPHNDMPAEARIYGALGRIDLATGDRTILAADETQFPHASPIPGRADVLYAARDTNGGATYLAWIDCTKPIGPAPAPPARPRDGAYEEQFEHGGPKLRAHYKAGVLDGTYEVWDWSGKLVERGDYRRGEKDGTWTTYFPDGKTRQRETGYARGKRDGVERSWWRDGTQAHEVTWRADKQQGTFRSWYEDGSPGMAGEFVDGLRDGVWKTWYPHTGTTPHLVTYAAGKEVSRAP